MYTGTHTSVMLHGKAETIQRAKNINASFSGDKTESQSYLIEPPYFCDKSSNLSVGAKCSVTQRTPACVHIFTLQFRDILGVDFLQ